MAYSRWACPAACQNGNALSIDWAYCFDFLIYWNVFFWFSDASSATKCQKLYHKQRDTNWNLKLFTRFSYLFCLSSFSDMYTLVDRNGELREITCRVYGKGLCVYCSAAIHWFVWDQLKYAKHFWHIDVSGVQKHIRGLWSCRGWKCYKFIAAQCVLFSLQT